MIVFLFFFLLNSFKNEGEKYNSCEIVFFFFSNWFDGF